MTVNLEDLRSCMEALPESYRRLATGDYIDAFVELMARPENCVRILENLEKRVGVYADRAGAGADREEME